MSTQPSPAELYQMAFDREYRDLETKVWVSEHELHDLVETLYALNGGAVDRDYIGQSLRRMVETYTPVPLIWGKEKARLELLCKLRMDEAVMNSWRP